MAGKSCKTLDEADGPFRPKGELLTGESTLWEKENILNMLRRAGAELNVGLIYF